MKADLFASSWTPKIVICTLLLSITPTTVGLMMDIPRGFMRF